MTKFKTGDRIAVYDIEATVKAEAHRTVGTVRGIFLDGRIDFDPGYKLAKKFPPWIVHPKQCRKIKEGVKRVPREIWVNEYDHKGAQPCAHYTKELADEGAVSDRLRCTHFREVLK